MHPQLQAVIADFESATERLRGLARTVPESVWVRRPDPTRWSIAECVAHLNLTARAYLPLYRKGIDQARALRSAPPRRYRRDLVGWLFWKGAGPPVRVKVKTTPPFVPTAAEGPDRLVPEFEQLQAEQIEFVRESDGLPIDRVMVTSPFISRIRYNLYACLTIQPRHEHRHLWQAEQVVKTIG